MIGFLFFLHLALALAFCYVLFSGYGRFNNRYVPPLEGLSGGFVLFLAVSEVLALPFLLFHLSFILFYVIFLMINIPIFVYSLFALIKGFKNNSIKKPTLSLLGVIASLFVIACVIGTQLFVKYDADDSYYVSLVAQNIGNSHLNNYDPSTGNRLFQTSSTYALEGWELIQSVLSKMVFVRPVEFSHSFIPILVIPLVFLTHRNIFKRLFKEKIYINFALICLALFFLFSGYSVYSQGTFLFTRGWQGKSLVATFIIPLLLFMFYRLYFEKQNRKKLYVTIFAINIAGVCLNPASIFINAAAISVFGAIILIKHRSIKDLLGLAISSLPIALAAFAAIFFTIISPNVAKVSTEDKIGTTSYLDYVHKFIGSSWYFYILIVGILILALTKKDKKILILVGLFPLLLLVTIINPFLFEPIKAYATSNTYWRLFWLVPVTIAIPYLGVIAAKGMGYSLKTMPGFAKYSSLTAFIPFVIVGLVIIFSGSFLYGGSVYPVSLDLTRSKTPPGVEQVADTMINKPEGRILAAGPVAAYFHNYTTHHELAVSRELYLSVDYEKASPEFTELGEIQKIIDDRATNFNPDNFQTLIRKYHIDYLVYRPGNIEVNRYTKTKKYPLLFTSPEYLVVKVPQK